MTTQYELLKASAVTQIQSDLENATAADRAQTELDAQATAADRIQTGQDASAAEGAASSANADADRAEIARDAAFTNADVYPDIATGRAAVADGEQFIVVTGDVANRYRRDSSSAQTLVASYPLAGIVPVLDGGIGALAVVIGQVVKQVNGGHAALAGGSLSDPALRIGDIAIYSAASNTVSVGIAGVEVARFTAQGMTVFGTVTEE